MYQQERGRHECPQFCKGCFAKSQRHPIFFSNEGQKITTRQSLFFPRITQEQSSACLSALCRLFSVSLHLTRMLDPESNSCRGGDVSRSEEKAGSDTTQSSSSSPSSPSSSSSSPSSPPPPPPQQQQQQQRPRSSNNPPPPSCTACAGVTVYSRAHHDAGKPPSCLGVSRRRTHLSDVEAAEPTLLPPDVAPGGDFKFLCVGYAVCRDGANKKKEDKVNRGGAGGAGAAGSGRNLDDDDVELPACLGVHIIRAAAATPAAMPMRGGATGMASTSGNSSERQQQRKPLQPQQQPRRAPLARSSNANTSSPTPAPELPSLLDALDKWEKSARRVAMRMGSNLVSIFGGRE